MFTIADLCHIAMQIERNGEETYRRAARAAQPEIAAALLRLADEERRHAQFFENIAGNRHLAGEERELAEAGRRILQDMVGENTFSLDEGQLQRTENLEDLLAVAQEFEEDTILFYQMLEGFIDTEEVGDLLRVIIAEERMHIDELRRIVTEPRRR